MIPFLLISITILISVWVEESRINKLRHDIDVLSEELEDYSNKIKEFDERLHAIENKDQNRVNYGNFW